MLGLLTFYIIFSTIMNTEVGIYRGSFDPPHNGHLEAVTCALQNGISPITIIYKDTNRYKPFRSSDETRKNFLISMFSGMSTVVISNKSYKDALNELLLDSTVSKIYQIIGSDLLSQPVRPLKFTKNLAYFIHDRGDFPLVDIKRWNDLPVKIGNDRSNSSENPSSSLIRVLFQNRQYQKVQSYFPPQVFQRIVDENAYVPTDNEYPFRQVTLEVKKALEKGICAKKLIAEDDYPLSFQLGKDIGVSGLSGDLICFISDKHKQMRLVVKVFLGDNYIKNYESELLGYQVISNLKLKLVKVPTLYMSEAKSGFAFICMSYVKGKSLAELMTQSPEAIRLCARANLELHTAQTASDKVTSDHLNFYEKTIHKVIEKLNLILDTDFLQEQIISKLTNHWDELRKSFLSNPVKLSFTHGDPNHSNWIVDLEKQEVTYIDLSLFSRSVFNQQTPFGFAANELEESVLSFKIAAKRLDLSREKTEEMQNIYNDEYMLNAPQDIMTKEAKRYFTAYWRLRVIENILEKLSSAQAKDDILKYQLQLQRDIDIFLN